MSLRLPVVDTTSSFADRGTARHLYLSQVSELGSARALAMVPTEHRDACAALPLGELPTELPSEVAMAYNIATGEARELGRGTNRGYRDLGPMELAGTADAVGFDNGTLRVVEYKSAGYSTRARDSLQLRLLALMAARIHGAAAVQVEVYRLDDSGDYWYDAHTYDAEALEAFAEELRAWFARAAAANPTPHVGAWCHHCPSYIHCPAQTALVRQLATGGGWDGLEMMKPLTPELVGLAWDRMRAARSLLARIEAACHAALEEFGGSVPLPGGRSLRRVIADGNERLDGDTVHRVVAERFGAGVADQAVERKASKTRLKQALKAAGLKVAPAEREVLDAVRSLGGSERPKASRIVEVEAAKEVA